ncbi:hypothetical protein SAMN06265379_103378 [Saccharicrinis carchari]|uniref:Uncharacterized protein n=1 Tax=Saccharicrinis carchari TaxID=1168039 RepID=A0A521CQ67_SACCC|nr:hypothetical protein SAMN06265379_103378 [Saccharicrinis carchari]
MEHIPPGQSDSDQSKARYDISSLFNENKYRQIISFNGETNKQANPVGPSAKDI